MAPLGFRHKTPAGKVPFLGRRRIDPTVSSHPVAGHMKRVNSLFGKSILGNHPNEQPIGTTARAGQ